MRSALFNAFLGISLTLVLSTMKLGLSFTDGVVCIVGSIVAGLLALLLYTAAGRNPWTRRHIVGGALRTWIFFLAAYFGLMLAFAAPLRETVNFEWLIIPVILATGLTIMIFGPIQDWLVSKPRR